MALHLSRSRSVHNQLKSVKDLFYVCSQRGDIRQQQQQKKERKKESK